MILKVKDCSAVDSVPGWFVVGDVMTVEYIPSEDYDVNHLTRMLSEHGLHLLKVCYDPSESTFEELEAPSNNRIPRVTCALLIVKCKESSYLIAFDSAAYLCNDEGKTVEKFSGMKSLNK